MATDTPASDDPKTENFSSRPPRIPPTLDLKAEEVAAEHGTAGAAAPPPPADDVAFASDRAAAHDTDLPPDTEPASAEQAAEAAVADTPPPAAPAPAPARSGSLLGALLAGVVGGGAVAGGLWYALPQLYPPAPPPPAPVAQPAPRVDLAPLQSRIAALEARPAADPAILTGLSDRLDRSEAALKQLEEAVAALKAAPAAPPPAPEAQAVPLAAAPAAPPPPAVPPELVKTVDELKAGADAGREAVATLRRDLEALKTSDSALQAAVGAANGAAQQAGGQVQALGAQVQGLVTQIQELTAQVKAMGPKSEELAGQIQAIGPRLDALKKDIAAAAASASQFNRNAAGLVVIAGFRDAVVSGRPFASELAAAKATLGGGAGALDPFAASAGDGFAPPAKLAERLAREGAAAIGTPAPAPADPSASLVDRLMASAENLVKVRPASGPGGVDAEGLIATAVTQVRSGQLEDALRTLKQLPETVQQRLLVMRDIEARATAVRVAATLYQQQLATISGKTQ
ncbi:hypothetical protein ABLE93_17415 [Xanthobacter sp. KR7-65]|uniref:COG4223 family protein n=1 Tax=Xanthobacter sp. KR7-65 TaxID=3156612 RepID=UPI0032B59420